MTKILDLDLSADGAITGGNGGATVAAGVLILDGIDSLVDLPTITAELAPLDTYSIKTTVKNLDGASNSYNAIFGCNSSTGSNILNLLATKINVNGTYHDHTRNIFTDASTPAEVEVKLENGSMLVYADGELINTVNVKPTIDANCTFTIGQEYDNASNSDFFHGEYTAFIVDDLLVDPAIVSDAQEKILISSLKLDARLGASMELQEVVTLFLTNSAEAQTAIDVLSAGGTFDELRTAGLSELESMRVMALFNMTVDPVRYESEKALSLIVDSPDNLVLFRDYLTTKGIELPTLDKYIADLRADQTVYTEARLWAAQLPAPAPATAPATATGPVPA